MKRFTFLLLLIAQNCIAQRVMHFGFESEGIQARMKTDVSMLASAAHGGRPAGTGFEAKSAAYICGSFREVGIHSKKLPFDVSLDSNQVLHCSNVIAMINHHADSTILITAHFDHLGLGSGKSLEIKNSGIHPGADDNASGVAMMLELARELRHSSSMHYNFVFVALTAHEIGLFGSNSFVKSRFASRLNIKLCLNLDMVGRLNPTTPTIRFSYCEQFPNLKNRMEPVVSTELHALEDAGHSTVNDYSVFCQAGWPTISLTTGVHDDYHRISDTADKINYPGMVVVLRYCQQLLGQ